ncbi:MAG: hypothetical protein J6334_06595 [Kiritimatiellae bacterium]|nr:hypothetical protein [Kiritimatiellia bacterium]
MKGSLRTNHIILLTAATLTASSLWGAAPVWPEPDREMKPWAYNWWMASAVDETGLKAQCVAMRDAGMGGFHVIPIYGAKGYEDRAKRYLSPEWMDAFATAVRLAGEHGLGVDMTMGNGWCFGGPQLTREEGCWKLVKTPKGEAPYVTWALTGQKVKRAGPGGAGPMMDPYSTKAMRDFLKPFAVFDAAGSVKPCRVYHDSWEYFQAGWSPELFEAFKRKRGYDLQEHLKELAGIGTKEAVGKVRLDYRETLSDIVIEDVFPIWVEWAHRHGIQTRNEAHGSPANWLDFYALADIPETEMFAEECRDILVSKFASSAAHVTGKRYVTSESCTWVTEHFTETLADLKIFIDRLFLSGVNHMYYHGCCYSPTDVVWPGWCFYASAQMNPRNPIWRDADLLNAYITRCQSLFQTWTPDNDVLLYWPIRDTWYEADGFEQMFTVHNASGWFHARPIGAEARRLAAEGYGFDYVSDRQLQNLDLSRYARLVIPPCRQMPDKTREAVERFTQREARPEPFPAAGLTFTRFRRDAATLYFLVNTNQTAKTFDGTPSAAGKSAYLMDPMTGAIRSLPRTPDGKLHLELDPFASCFLLIDPAAVDPALPAVAPRATRPLPIRFTTPWRLSPVCGGPALPPERTMTTLTTWSRNADGGEVPFSGTMRYTATFTCDRIPVGEVTLDLGDIRHSARVRINGREAGFAIMAPYRVTLPAGVVRTGENTLEVEVTSNGANRIRWNDQTGVKWKYFTDANVITYGYKGPFNASSWPLAEYGLLGPVTLWE